MFMVAGVGLIFTGIVSILKGFKGDEKLENVGNGSGRIIPVNRAGNKQPDSTEIVPPSSGEVGEK